MNAGGTIHTRSPKTIKRRNKPSQIPKWTNFELREEWLLVFRVYTTVPEDANSIRRLFISAWQQGIGTHAGTNVGVGPFPWPTQVGLFRPAANGGCAVGSALGVAPVPPIDEVRRIANPAMSKRSASALRRIRHPPGAKKKAAPQLQGTPPGGVRPMFLVTCVGRIMDAASTRKMPRSAHP